ncbi:putative TetR family transcriptional regulator [Nocardia brasiliensis NBRC 14402]|uniref:TetR/AcrR family transcriptional regulator n=1 Tax=Nocardia brasiliensis TaxID=37326 RepID=UPI000304D715|nr:TetR/AcrR family transcriptional regulator [Nocardia brasiliensis]ASF08639.1 TetR family transcriptional regulator [Nocardia brasiliensis]GAJ81381.1 putative TetR family transcriptional regulator [Nocardia brasiliensis NBRC 14402]SUB40845.1 transcriptional regulator BetI [Nocardia brasiliensis]
MAEELSLRERKKLDTRRALSDAALHLAFEHGLDNVTREDIASRAGVSIRTFNNYFAGKHEALAYRNVDRIRRSLTEFRNRPADEPLWTAITEAIVAPFVADGIRDTPPTKTQLAGVRTLVELSQTYVAISKELVDEWVAAIARRTGTDPARDMYPHLVTGVLIAVMKSAAVAYVHADPPVVITTLLRRGFDDVAAGLPEPSGH